MSAPPPNKKQATRALGPQIPAPYELAHASAIQALVRGEADEHQQKLAIDWIIRSAAGMYEFQYYPTDRDTAFALGRGFVGQQIVKLTSLNLMSLRGDKS